MIFLQKIKELATLGSGEIFGSALSAIFWFYLASQIEPDAYGEIHWFLGIAGIFSYVALFGTLNTITVYTAKNIKIQSALYSISLASSILLSLIVIIIFPAFYQIDSGILLIAYVINTLALGDLLGRKLYNTYARYILVQKGLTLALGLSFFYIFGYESILFALAISYVFYIKRIIIVFRDGKINFNLVKQRIGFITNNYAMFLLGGLINQVDKIIIAPLLGYALLGNYSLALQAITIMMIFSSVFYKYILPQDSTGVSNKKLKILVVIISIAISVIGIFLGSFLIDEFFPKFLEAKEAIQILSISVVPSTILLIFQSQFLGSEKSRVVLIGTGISLVLLTSGMIILGQMYGIVGLSWSFIISISANVAFCACIHYKNSITRNMKKI